MSGEKKRLSEEEIRGRLSQLSAESGALKHELAIASSEYADALGEINRQYDRRCLPIKIAMSGVEHRIAEVQRLCPRYPHMPILGPRQMPICIKCPVCGADPDHI